MTPAEIAKAALCEAGRPDLADTVRENTLGWPTSHLLSRWRHPDRALILKAFVLAHQSRHAVDLHIGPDGVSVLNFNPRSGA